MLVIKNAVDRNEGTIQTAKVSNRSEEFSIQTQTNVKHQLMKLCIYVPKIINQGPHWRSNQVH